MKPDLEANAKAIAEKAGTRLESWACQESPMGAHRLAVLEVYNGDVRFFFSLDADTFEQDVEQAAAELREALGR